MDREQIKNELEQVAIDVAAVEDPALAAAVGKLLNLVERLVGGIDRLQAENDRLKKRDKDNDRDKEESKEEDQKDKDQPSGQDSQDNRDVSSEKARREREQRSGRPGSDARTFKDLPIHETIVCPVDPQELPPDAERMNEESFVAWGQKTRTTLSLFGNLVLKRRPANCRPTQALCREESRTWERRFTCRVRTVSGK